MKSINSNSLMRRPTWHWRNGGRTQQIQEFIDIFLQFKADRFAIEILL